MRLATKDDLEREDEEAERLVRPAPKDKPPRRDLRREQMDLEKDPDTEGESDPDMSKNYKDVGGSAARVLMRWADAGQKLIPVRHKKTQEVVMVAPDTLKGPKSGDYEALKDDEKKKAIEEAKAKEQEKAEKAKGKGKGKGESKKKDDPDEPDPEQIKAEVAAWVETGEGKKSNFKRFLGAIPTSHEDEFGNPTVLDPETKKRVPFEKLQPAAQKNLIDDYSARQRDAQADKDTLKQGKAAAAAMEELDPVLREAFETLADPNSEASRKSAEIWEQIKDSGSNFADVRPEKIFPELRGKLPKNIASVAKISQLVYNARDYNALSSAERAGIKPPKRSEPTPEERQASILLIAETFPEDTAADIIAQDLHPDDVKDLAKGYHSAKSEPVKDIKDYASKAAEHYETNISQIKPPQKWDGKPFNLLSSEQKTEAMRQHQVDTLALSLAAKEKLTHELSMPGKSGKPRVHPAVAAGVANFMLSKPSDPIKARELADKMAEAAYDTAVRDGSGEKFIADDATAKKLLETLDPGSKKIVQGFIQARDYHEAKDKFLDKDGTDEAEDKESFSERDSPSTILSGLKKVVDFFKASLGNDGDHRSEDLLKKRVMDRLRALEPKKHAIVQAKTDKIEAKQYEAEHKKWGKAHDKWKKARDKHFKTQPFGGAGKGSIPFPDVEPTEPSPPARYGEHAKKDKKTSLFETMSGRRKAASRVAQRYVSTYPGWLAMDQSFKTAMYHGVEPYADDPGTYPDWEPAHQRDLGEADFEAILASANEWLGSNVLTQNTDGMERDQQFRAALDLAIQVSIYNRKIHPAVYNMLLARLAGEPEPGPGQTLQTVRGSTCAPSGAGDILPGQGPGKSTETTMTTKLSAEQSKQASDILTHLDNLALAVKAKFASWGMTQEDAKKVVNGLDSVADNFERATFGEESLQKRQAEICAAVIQRDSDEPYMDTFQNPHQPVQTDADEPYMGAYGDDQSSAVDTGKEENGEALVP